jgi:hypothetical protein
MTPVFSAIRIRCEGDVFPRYSLKRSPIVSRHQYSARCVFGKSSVAFWCLLNLGDQSIYLQKAALDYLGFVRPTPPI